MFELPYIVDLPQTVPAVVVVNKSVTEDNALPQTRPPFVNAAVDIAAIAAVSAPGILLEISI